MSRYKKDKVHLFDNRRNGPFCRVRPQFRPFQFTHDYREIDCIKCKAVVDAYEKQVLKEMKAKNWTSQ
jgi:hypothetical protein